MNPTEVLKKEHVSILEMTRVMVKVSDKLDSGEDVNPEDLEQIIDFIKNFADKCHHRKEEDLLFVAMTEAGIPKEGGPVGIMLSEHDLGRNYVKGMSEAAAAYKSGDKSAGKKFSENARGYVDLLSQHIHKEDNILYPMADKVLSPEKQSELIEGFEKVEKADEEVHGKELAVLQRLADIYLAS